MTMSFLAKGIFMKSRLFLLAAAVALTGCSSTMSKLGVARPSGDVVAVNDDHGSRPRKLTGVPRGHYPPPGQCRLWYTGRPPGHQPAATRCESLVGRVPRGAFVLYNNNAWDSSYDWKSE